MFLCTFLVGDSGYAAVSCPHNWKSVFDSYCYCKMDTIFKAKNLLSSISWGCILLSWNGEENDMVCSIWYIRPSFLPDLLCKTPIPARARGVLDKTFPFCTCRRKYMQDCLVFFMCMWDQWSVWVLWFAEQITCPLSLTIRLFPNIDHSENFVTS